MDDSVAVERLQNGDSSLELGEDIEFAGARRTFPSVSYHLAEQPLSRRHGRWLVARRPLPAEAISQTVQYWYHQKCQQR
jgi:hypothetical protein